MIYYFRVDRFPECCVIKGHILLMTVAKYVNIKLSTDFISEIKGSFIRKCLWHFASLRNFRVPVDSRYVAELGICSPELEWLPQWHLEQQNSQLNDPWIRVTGFFKTRLITVGLFALHRLVLRDDVWPSKTGFHLTLRDRELNVLFTPFASKLRGVGFVVSWMIMVGLT